MASATEMRQWALDNDYDVSPRGRIPKNVHDAYLLAHGQDDLIEPTAHTDTDSPVPSFSTGERKPDVSPRRRSFKPRAKGRPRKRQSIASLSQHVWTAASFFTKKHSTALAKVLAFQSPVAGIIIEESITHGGRLDRLLQPFARSEQKATRAYALVAPPLIAAAIEANPELYPVLSGPLKLALLEWMKLAKPAMDKLEQEQTALLAELAESGIDQIIDEIFSHMIQENEPDGN